MRMLLAGAWQYPVYEIACADALKRLGVLVIPFRWSQYFSGFVGRMQIRFPFAGPALMRLNRDLLDLACESNPDCIWVWRGTHILPRSLQKLKTKTRALLVSYNNDDPFGTQNLSHAPWYQTYFWRNYWKAVPEYDVHFVYRGLNVSEVLRAGAKQAHVLRSYFIPGVHRPVSLSGEEERRYGCDVVFVGHYEPDGRLEYLRALLKAGLHVRLFGGATWTPRSLDGLAGYFADIHPVVGDEYSKALCGARMCLCFLSRLNRDTYTRRCFEIPACGCLLLSERTHDLQTLFLEDEEAVFFSSKEELVEKALWLRDHPNEIVRIAGAGLRRVHKDGHSVDDRMREFLSVLEKIGR